LASVPEKHRLPGCRCSLSGRKLAADRQCRFLGAGEVYARADHVAQWKFAFDFEKVLMFLREPGGSGEVIEVQRDGVLL
jgi:hypothetical protein